MIIWRPSVAFATGPRDSAGMQEVFDEQEYDEIAKYLIYVKVEDRLTGCDFKSVLLDDPVYHPSSILWLHSKVKMLYKVDVKVIEHENAIVP